MEITTSSSVREASQTYYPTDELIQNVFGSINRHFDIKEQDTLNLSNIFPKKTDKKKLNVLLLSTTFSASKSNNKDKENTRKSTSEYSLLKIQEHLKKTRPDVSTVIVRLAELSFSPCEGNYSKEKNLCSWPCQITLRKSEDQLSVIYYSLVDWADVVIVATPIRYGQPSALYYKMVERLTCVHNQLTLNDASLIVDKVAAFVITGGQDNVQQVAGQMLLFWSELGFTFAGHSYVGWSRGWNNEKMGTNYDEMTHNAEYETDLLRLVNDALEMKDRLDRAPLSTTRIHPTSHSEYVVESYLESQNKGVTHKKKPHVLMVEEKIVKETTSGARYFEGRQHQCTKSDIQSNTLKMFNLDGKHIAVINDEGKIRAFDGICTHARVQFDDGPLGKDSMDGRNIIFCNAHSAEFDCKDGKIRNQKYFEQKYSCRLDNLTEYKVIEDKSGTLFVEC